MPLHSPEIEQGLLSVRYFQPSPVPLHDAPERGGRETVLACFLIQAYQRRAAVHFRGGGTPWSNLKNGL